jgi:hypothetical protein
MEGNPIKMVINPLKSDAHATGETSIKAMKMIRIAS